MPDLPIMLKIEGARCVIVGGGSVATRRAKALGDAGGHVVVIAPSVHDDLHALAAEVHQRPYQPGDLQGARLVIAATDNTEINDQISLEAATLNTPCNRADDPAKGTFSVPAHAQHGPITLAVYTGGASASAAAAIRRSMSESLDPDWPRLLTLIAPYRQLIKDHATSPDEKRQKLIMLAGPEAMSCLKQGGEAELLRFCESITGQAD